jgi:hypothetical protein
VTKWISAAVSGLLGAGLAVVAAWGVVSSATHAPSQNPAPANLQKVQYGNR